MADATTPDGTSSDTAAATPASDPATPAADPAAGSSDTTGTSPSGAGPGATPTAEATQAPVEGTTPSDVAATIDDAAAGSLVLNTSGELVVDKGSPNRDPVPSPYEHRDSVRNRDDATSAPSEIPTVEVQEAMGRIGWQIGNFDAQPGSGDLLQNLAYPTAGAVAAERAVLDRAQSTGADATGLAPADAADQPQGVGFYEEADPGFSRGPDVSGKPKKAAAKKAAPKKVAPAPTTEGQ